MAIVFVLKQKLHTEASAFDTFIEKYHSFIGEMREARKLIPKEMEKFCHLLPFEKQMDNELTILLEAPPVRSAGLFATKFLQSIHQATSMKDLIDQMCEDYYKKSPPENMDVDRLERVFQKIATHVLEEEGDDDEEEDDFIVDDEEELEYDEDGVEDELDEAERILALKKKAKLEPFKRVVTYYRRKEDGKLEVVPESQSEPEKSNVEEEKKPAEEIANAQQ